MLRWQMRMSCRLSAGLVVKGVGDDLFTRKGQLKAQRHCAKLLYTAVQSDCCLLLLHGCTVALLQD